MKDFNGTNGMKLSIKKWVSIIIYLDGIKGDVLSEEERWYLDDKTSTQCGICFEHILKDRYGQEMILQCGQCPLSDDSVVACCKEYRTFAESLRNYWLIPEDETHMILRMATKDELLVLAYDMLNKLESLKGD